jgi:hypothetical protein
VAEQLRRPHARAARELQHVAGRPERVERRLQLPSADGARDHAVEVLGRAGAVVGDLLGEELVAVVCGSHAGNLRAGVERRLG